MLKRKFILDHQQTQPNIKRRKIDAKGTFNNNKKILSWQDIIQKNPSQRHKLESKTTKTPTFYLQNQQNVDMINRAIDSLQNEKMLFTIDDKLIHKDFTDFKNNSTTFQILHAYFQAGKPFINCIAISSTSAWPTHIGQVFELDIYIVLNSINLWTSRLFTEKERNLIVQKPTHHLLAQKRSNDWANLLAKNLAKNDFHIFLDGPGRNFWATVHAKIPTKNGVIFEKRKETALYHKLSAIVLGIQIHTIYAPNGFQQILLNDDEKIYKSLGLPTNFIKKIF
jgi:hypothetical protein